MSGLTGKCKNKRRYICYWQDVIVTIWCATWFDEAFTVGPCGTAVKRTRWLVAARRCARTENSRGQGGHPGMENKRSQDFGRNVCFHQGSAGRVEEKEPTAIARAPLRYFSAHLQPAEPDQGRCHPPERQDGVLTVVLPKVEEVKPLRLRSTARSGLSLLPKGAGLFLMAQYWRGQAGVWLVRTDEAAVSASSPVRLLP